MIGVATLLAALLPITVAQIYPVFDGKIRETPDGRHEAYLIPPAVTNHASFLQELPNGDFVVAWFAGTAEGADNCSIVMAYLPKDSYQWSGAKLVSRRPGYSNQNPVLFLDPTGQVLYLFHTQQPATSLPPSSAEADAHVWMLQSFDGGVNWTTPRDVLTENGSYDRNRILYSVSGDWIFPIYYSADEEGDQYSAMMISSDQHTWKRYPIPGSNYLVQPSVVRPDIAKTLLLAFLRDKRAEYIYTSISTDDGFTWSEPLATELPNNDAAIQAYVLNNGHIVLLYNPTNKERVPLRVSISEDGGVTWPYSRDLETSNVTTSEFSYPSIYQTGHDDYIHVTYTYNRETIKYVKFPESWVKSG